MAPEYDTIAAPATAAGGAIAVLRVSGPEALSVCDRIFRGRIKLSDTSPNTVHYGRIVEPDACVNGSADRLPAHDPTAGSLSALQRPTHQPPAVPQSECKAAVYGTNTVPTTDRGETPPPFGTESSGEAFGGGVADASDCFPDPTGCASDNSSGAVRATAAEAPAGSGKGERTIDDVVAAVFRAPHSYTGEDTVEISCHGSVYIVSEILRLLIASGARMAQPGEFTTRAFLAGKLDLAQAEAVADLIASSSRTAHALASAQMRGGYSSALHALRGRLVELMSLLELELDFAEEDVEFADRTELRETMRRIDEEIEALRNSFSLGNALKRGVAVAIVGAPNVGKSTLLNRLLGEERAMVSEIAGTTRDAIEETMDIDGVLFRFIDTAGIRATDDRLERMGIERTHAAIARAQIVIRMTDAQTKEDGLRAEGSVQQEYPADIGEAGETVADRSMGGSSAGPATDTKRRSRTIDVINKIDKAPNRLLPAGAIAISAREGTGIDRLREALRAAVDTEALYHGDPVVSSARHYEALTSAHIALGRALRGIDGALSSDLLGEELRSVLYHLGTITGEITNDEILGTIFSKFCIGK